MFSKSKQGFRTIDLITLVFCLLAVGLIAGPIIQRNLEAQKTAQIEKDLKLHSARLLDDQKFLNQVRSPSSVEDKNHDQVGKDPWGQPYEYMVLKNAYGQSSYFVIWSKGPNKKLDTTIFSSRGPSSVVFQGDDVGLVQPIH